MEPLVATFVAVHAWVFEALIQPLLYWLGLMTYAEDAFEALEVPLYGVIEIILLFALLRPLEAWRPVEHWDDRRAVRVDVLYTVLHRVGVLPLLVFVLLQPVVDGAQGLLRLHGLIPGNLEELIPALATHPLPAFLAYVVILDFAEYWRHRLQHRFDWWWALHSLHHSQRQLSLWADRRNHLLDDMIGDVWFAAIALLIGVPSDQFLVIVILVRMIESLSHTNIRVGFGAVGDRLLVSPRYHRIHHGIGTGHDGGARGCNFAPLLPLWDVLFGTANFAHIYPPTGIRDQLDGVDYGSGFFRQQLLGVKRLMRALGPR